METTLDRFGRVVIPKRVRDGLGLRPGAVLIIEERGNGLHLMPVPEGDNLREEDGVLVFAGRVEGDLSACVRAEREARLDDVSG